MNPKVLFLFFNTIGGVAVLGSYVWGFVSYPELRTEFWGEVPESIKGLYTLNMFFAAAGFLAAFGFFMIKERADNLRRLYLPYTLILIPSALWLPLTVAVLQNPSQWLWWVIRIDLFAVGLGGLMVWVAVLKTQNTTALLRGLVCFAMTFFILQTAILDAVVWPAYFVLPAQ